MKLPENFESMLSYICGGAAQHRWSRQGKPRTADSDMVFCAVMKAVRRESARTLIPYLKQSQGRGLLGHVPSSSSVQLFLKRADTRQVLIRTIIYSSDLLARVPAARRIHTRVRFTKGFVVFGRSYDTLINEALCFKTAEMVLKCCIYGVTETPVVLNSESLLALLKQQLPEGLPRHVTEEIYQEMVVAVLNGEVRPEHMRASIGKLLRRVRAFDPSPKFLSLDAPVLFSEKSRTFGDELAAHG